WYADWRDARGTRRRRAFRTASEAQAHERRQKRANARTPPTIVSTHPQLELPAERARLATARALTTVPAGAITPNRGMPLHFDWVDEVRVNTSAVERRAATMGTRRTVKKEWQAAWLLRAITCMDLTTLAGDDTHERVRRLCAKARHPLQESLVRALKIEELDIKVGAVCVYHHFVETAVRALAGSGIPVAAVSTGFPHGLSPLAERVAEIRRSVEA